jgi:hypothetical protein
MRRALEVALVAILGFSSQAQTPPRESSAKTPPPEDRRVHFYNGIVITVPADVCIAKRVQADFVILEFKRGTTTLAGAYAGNAGNFPGEECQQGHRAPNEIIQPAAGGTDHLLREEVVGPKCREIAFSQSASSGQSSSGVLFHLWFGSARDEKHSIEQLLKSVRLDHRLPDDSIPAGVACPQPKDAAPK